MIKIHFIPLFAFILLIWSCEEAAYTPKPRAYPKIDFPVRNYETFSADNCNFTFKYPTYAQIMENENRPEDATADCWFDLYMPAFDSRLHCTYYDIKSQDEFATLWNDAFDLANKHNVRADFIEETRIATPKGISGFAFDIKGPAASPYQFFLTDSTQHFLRASLYFNTQVRQDSMAPVYDFVIEDLIDLMRSFEWKDTDL